MFLLHLNDFLIQSIFITFMIDELRGHLLIFIVAVNLLLSCRVATFLCDGHVRAVVVFWLGLGVHTIFWAG